MHAKHLLALSLSLLPLRLLSAPALAAGEPFPSATPQAVVEVTGKVFPSVVRLDVAQEVYSEGKRTLQPPTPFSTTDYQRAAAALGYSIKRADSPRCGARRSTAWCRRLVSHSFKVCGSSGMVETKTWRGTLLASP